MSCLFCDIITRKIRTPLVYEDEWLVAFNDIHPQAPDHQLIIPKQHISTLNDLSDPTLGGRLIKTAATLAKQQGFADDGYRVVMNCNNDGGQTVYHIHLHLLGNRKMTWPPG